MVIDGVIKNNDTERIGNRTKGCTRQKALSAFETMRQSLVGSDMPQMSLEEINAEIKAAREERKDIATDL